MALETLAALETATQQKSGGGEWSRTTDAADMSRDDNESNLLDLLAEILLEATGGDNSQP